MGISFVRGQRRMGERRQFIDSSGFAWQVWEIIRSADDHPERAGHWLYFFSRGTTRVTSEFPATWGDLSWDALEDLCARSRVLGADRGAVLRFPALSAAR
jgi:hypothetical protein